MKTIDNSKVKLLIADIDSTIIVKHGLLSEKSKRCIDTLREHGVYFGLATGRPLVQIYPTLEKWGYEDFDVLLAYNGATIWDGIEKKEYNFFTMKKEWIKETIDLMSKFESNPSIYVGHQQWFKKEDYWVNDSARSSGLEVYFVKDLSEFYQEDHEKIMFRVDEKDMPEIEAWVNARPNENWVGFKTQPNLMEFCDKRVNKGFGLQAYCDLKGFSVEDVIAFGDTTNDNELLKVAGLGVCLLNGTEDTKAVADVITEKTIEEDGWGEWVETHYIKPLGWL